jgi:hypothetical protein
MKVVHYEATIKLMKRVTAPLLISSSGPDLPNLFILADKVIQLLTIQCHSDAIRRILVTVNFLKFYGPFSLPIIYKVTNTKPLATL